MAWKALDVFSDYKLTEVINGCLGWADTPSQTPPYARIYASPTTLIRPAPNLHPYLELRIRPCPPSGSLPAPPYEGPSCRPNCPPGTPPSLYHQDRVLYFSGDSVFPSDVRSQYATWQPVQITPSPSCVPDPWAVGALYGILSSPYWVPDNDFILTATGQQKVRNVIDALHEGAGPSNGWMPALGLSNEPNNGKGWWWDTRTIPPTLKRSDWYPLDSRAYADLWYVVIGYAMDYAKSRYGWTTANLPLVFGEVAERVSCVTDVLDNDNNHVDGAPDNSLFQDGDPDSRYINLALVHAWNHLGLTSTDWLSPGFFGTRNSILPTVFAIHKYGVNQTPSDYYNNLVMITGSGDARALSYGGNRSGQAPFPSPGRYALTEWAGHSLGLPPPQNLTPAQWFNQVWALAPAGSTLWNQGLHSMYWYTDWTSVVGETWMNIFNSPGQGCDRTALGDTIAAEPSP